MTRSLRVFLLAGLVGLSASAPAATLNLKDHRSEAHAGNFSAKLLITADPEWQAKWDTPPEVVPKFIRAESVGLAQKVWVLVFFKGAALNAKGEAQLSCDFRVTGPDGKVSMEKTQVECFKDRIGDAGLVYLSPVVLQITGEPGDATGLETIEVVVRDTVGMAQVKVKSTYYRRGQ